MPARLLHNTSHNVSHINPRKSHSTCTIEYGIVFWRVSFSYRGRFRAVFPASTSIKGTAPRVRLPRGLVRFFTTSMLFCVLSIVAMSCYVVVWIVVFGCGKANFENSRCVCAFGGVLQKRKTRGERSLLIDIG